MHVDAHPKAYAPDTNLVNQLSVTLIPLQSKPLKDVTEHLLQNLFQPAHRDTTSTGVGRLWGGTPIFQLSSSL